MDVMEKPGSTAMVAEHAEELLRSLPGADPADLARFLRALADLDVFRNHDSPLRARGMFLFLVFTHVHHRMLPLAAPRCRRALADALPDWSYLPSDSGELGLWQRGILTPSCHVV